MGYSCVIPFSLSVLHQTLAKPTVINELQAKTLPFIKLDFYLIFWEIYLTHFRIISERKTDFSFHLGFTMQCADNFLAPKNESRIQVSSFFLTLILMESSAVNKQKIGCAKMFINGVMLVCAPKNPKNSFKRCCIQRENMKTPEHYKHEYPM